MRNLRITLTAFCGVLFACAAWGANPSSCPSGDVVLPDSTKPIAQPTYAAGTVGNPELVGGSEGFSTTTNLGTQIVSPEETNYARRLVPAGPVPSGSPTPCPSYTWSPSNSMKPSDTNRVAIVMVKGSNANTLNSAKFYLTQSDKNDPRSGGLNSQVSSSLPASANAAIQAQLTAADRSPSTWAANGVRYVVLNIASGSGHYDGIYAETSYPGTLSFTTAFEIVAPSSAVKKAFGFYYAVKYYPRLKFMSSPVSVTADSCSSPMKVSLVDGNGAAFKLSEGDSGFFPSDKVSLSLTLSPASAFLDPSCLYNTSTMSIAKSYPASEPTTGRWNETISDSYVQFYLQSSKAQAGQQVSLSYTPGQAFIVSAVQVESVSGAAPNQLVFENAPSAVDQGKCSAPIVIGIEDQDGNDTQPSSNLSVGILKTASTTLYSDANCSNVISNVTIPAGQKTAAFYFRDNAAESLSLGVSGGSLLSDKINIRVLARDLVASPTSVAQAQDMARRLYLHLAGMPMDETKQIPDWNVDPSGTGPKYSQLKLYSDKILSGDIMQAAYLATREPGFYNSTLWNMITPLSDSGKNPLGTTGKLTDLNDFTATWIGIVRDDLNAQLLLTGNQIYVPKAYKPAVSGACARTDVYKSTQPYVDAMTAMYADPINNGLDKQLVSAPQCVYNNSKDLAFNSDNPIVHPDAAGLLTTRQWGVAGLYMGTNRRAIRFMLDRFLCHDITDVQDSSLTEWRIRRDVDHAPGGDPKIYQSSCRSCHTSLDSMGGAYAFYDSYPNPNQTTNPVGNLNDWRMFYVNSGGYGEDVTMPKMNKNNTVFPPGYVTGDDSWINFLTSNNWQPVFGWSSSVPTQGNGVHALGMMIANSDGFAKCMAKRVYQHVCTMGTPPAVDVHFNGPDAGVINDLSIYFQSTNYNMRRLFQKAASLSSCLGTGVGGGK